MVMKRLVVLLFVALAAVVSALSPSKSSAILRTLVVDLEMSRFRSGATAVVSFLFLSPLVQSSLFIKSFQSNAAPSWCAW